jgi:hypothetical protein
MPGAPNRPPEIEPTEPIADPTARRVARRLGPDRVALHLDLWKGAPSHELVVLLERAEACFATGDLVTAISHLDQLAVRFAEPRWPTMPMPFKRLRVEIPAPQPPQWDPDHALPPGEKEIKRLAREAETHRDLAEATIDWGTKHSIDLTDLAPCAERARATLAANGPSDAFWADIDSFWQSVRARVPMPKSSGRPAAPAPAAAPPAETA